MVRLARTLIGAWLALLVGAVAFGNGAIDWALYDTTCADGGSSAIEIPCGHYGVFLLQVEQHPPKCQPVAAGEEVPPQYSAPLVTDVFPIPARRMADIVSYPLPQGAPAGADPLAMPAGAASFAQPTSLPAVQSQPVSLPWVAVIDFEGPHGDSTTSLAGDVAGGEIVTVLASLEDPALDALGEEVGDFHVLAQLCKIAQMVDVDGIAPPLAVNMSFGRSVEPTDPETAAECDTRASCQIAKVVSWLRARGSEFVAAAGNHQQLLFPALLEDVIAAGMVDLSGLLHDRRLGPAWETPARAQAWIPGNALCLGSWGAPAGSSYSSALLTGWLIDVLRSSPDLDPTVGGRWLPRWHDAQGCWVLGQGRTLTPWCNAQITELFDGLGGDNEARCWSISEDPSAELPPPGPAQDQPGLPGLDAWISQTHPAPETDPCVPCVGHSVSVNSNPSLKLDLSQSPPLPLGVWLDSIFLRVGSAFHPLDVDPLQLDAIRLGELSVLMLTGAGTLYAPGDSLSLWYRLKHDEDGKCEAIGACYWSSTPILLKPAG